MGLAIAVLGWSPKQFWSATMHEFQSAVEAKEEINRG